MAAAKLADPDFFWEVLFFEDSKGQMQPYMEAGNGYFVAVKTVYGGKEHIEVLPIMNSFTYEVLENPGCDDWNRAVMRTLAKGIATQTGYGISLYTNEEPALAGFEPPSEEEVASLSKALVANAKTPAALLAWLGIGGDDLSVISREQYRRSMQALGAPIAEKEAQATPA